MENTRINGWILPLVIFTAARLFAGESPFSLAVLPSATVDMGIVGGDTPVAFFFTFENTGKNAIDLIRMRSECNCTTSNFVPQVLPPGESVYFGGMIAPPFKVGPNKYSIYLQTDIPGQEIITLAVEFDNYGDTIRIDPALMRITGIMPEEEVERKVKVIFPRGERLTLDSASTSSANVELPNEFSPILDHGPYRAVEFPIKVRYEKENKIDIYLHFSGEGDRRISKTLPVELIPSPSFSIRPVGLVLSRENPSGIVEIELTAGYEKHLSMNGAFDNGGLKVNIFPIQDHKIRLEVSFPREVNGNISIGAITLPIDLGEKIGVARIPVIWR